MLHTETVEEGTLALIKRLSGDEKFKDFNLVGGTALALQIGHRKSVDIDLFTNRPFDADALARHLVDQYLVKRIETQKNQVAAIVDNVKLDILAHQYKEVAPPNVVDGIRMASLDEIAAMKINAIHVNGTRLKDFADMYHLLEHRTMREMRAAHTTKYPEAAPWTVEMSLLSHFDVQMDQKLDSLYKNLKWPDISKRIREAVYKPDKKYKQVLEKKPALDGPGRDLPSKRKPHR